MYFLIVAAIAFALFGLGLIIFNWIVGIILVVVVISMSIRIVSPKTVKSVEFLGSFNRILRPGLNFIIPILEWTRPQQLYRQNLEVKVDGVSKDNVTVYIGLNCIYYVEDDGDDTEGGLIYKSIYNIDNPITMMRSTIDEQLRAMITQFDHKGIFTKREEIGTEIEEKLREKLSTFGYRIDSIQVKNIDLNDSVMKAMNKVAEAQREKEAATNQGEAEKIKEVKKAEADKESKILIGQGIAGQRKEIADGFKQAMDKIRQGDNGLTGSEVLKFLIDSTRVETLGHIGEKGNSRLIYLNENLEGRSFSKDGKLISGSNIMNTGDGIGTNTGNVDGTTDSGSDVDKNKKNKKNNGDNKKSNEGDVGYKKSHQTSRPNPSYYSQIGGENDTDRLTREGERVSDLNNDQSQSNKKTKGENIGVWQ